MSETTTRRVNIAAPDFIHFPDFPDFPDGFRPGIARLGTRMGATGTGAVIIRQPSSLLTM